MNATIINRRLFLQRAAILTVGVVAADQLELIERLGWRRRLFPGWGHTLYGDGLVNDTVALQAFVDGRAVWYKGQRIRSAIETIAQRGRIVTIPAGVFKLTQPLELNSDDATLVCYGAVLHGAGLKVSGIRNAVRGLTVRDAITAIQAESRTTFFSS